MADKLFTLHILILNHPAALPDTAEQPPAVNVSFTPL
jgi:hypothetical protein